MVGIFRSEVIQAREGIGAGARPWERTGSIDVEQLAAWAYGVQMVDRFERVGLHAIEAEISGFEPHGYSADGVGHLMAIEHLGCRIDHRAVAVTDAIHPVAYAVASAVGEISGGPQVRFHAMAGTRPDAWIEPEHKVRPRAWAKQGEKAQVEYVGPGRKGAHCPIIIVWTKDREEWGRREYTRWWEGLTDLAWRLSTRALGFTVTGPLAPAQPWIEGNRTDENRSHLTFSDPPSRVLPGDHRPMGCGSAGAGDFRKI